VRFELKGYQEEATEEIIDALNYAFERFDKSQKLSAISLSAATGAGKTVIATAVIERLLYGSETTTPNPNLTFLWLTDDPSLNEQTRRKMLDSSSKIKAGQLVQVSANLDQRMLDPGKVYFCHIQQLGRGATNYNQVGDGRTFSLWDIIGNTINNRGNEFVLVIDEAHRGTKRRAGGGQTITAQFIEGNGGTMPAVPVAVGISGTPKRFRDAIAAGSRNLEPVDVDVEAVRESGLLKDKILIKHRAEAQEGSATLLTRAVADLKAYDTAWAEFAESEKEPGVEPVLVVQVKAKTTDAEYAAILDILSREWGELTGRAVAHAFQEHGPLRIGDKSIRYVAPQDIQDDPNLRVILFKEALTTGWDCPRAEVMLSFRSAKDETYIAQLIGRMVRTPLARRIPTNGFLNTVGLYLPDFDDAQVTEVVRGLKTGDDAISSEIEVEPTVLTGNPEVSDEVWAKIAQLPSYSRPTKFHRNDVVRLYRLAALLGLNEIEPEAMELARQQMIGVLELQAMLLGAELEEKVRDLNEVIYQVQSYDMVNDSVFRELLTAVTDSRDIEAAFKKAQRTLSDGTALWFWEYLCDKGEDPDEAKVYVAALADFPQVMAALDSAAKTLIDTWHDKHNSAIVDLPDAKRAKFYSIWAQAKEPEPFTLIMPSEMTTGEKENLRSLHLYANSKKTYPGRYNGWELEVIDCELAKMTLDSWYRNPTGGLNAIGVPYRDEGGDHTMYPDFLFFHNDLEGGLVVDIVDPHRPNESDTIPKWVGLTKYAGKHGDQFRRIVAVIKDESDKLVSLDLKNPAVEKALSDASGEPGVRAVFKQFGGGY
jgi:type III restriction enzyme